MKIVAPSDWAIPAHPHPRDWTPGQVVPSQSPGSPCVNGCVDGHLVGWKITTKGNRHYFEGDWWRYAELISAPCPVCQGTARHEWLVENSGLIGLSLEGKSMTALAMPRPAKGQDAALEAAKRALSELPYPKTWVMLHGAFGSGKTHILASMVNACVNAGVWARYATASQMLQSLRSTYDPMTKRRYDDVSDEWTSVPALALDELDRVSLTDWASEHLFATLEARHTAGRATWLASNASPDDLTDKGGPLAAIVSRASAGLVVHLQTPDLRPAMQEDML